MNEYFKIGENVFVKYARGCAKYGRVESIQKKGNEVFYFVSIDGLKHHKKCCGCDLIKANKVVDLKPTTNKYNVHYSFYLSDAIEVEAESEREAEEIVDRMICNGEIGNLNEMYIGEQKIWCD